MFPFGGGLNGDGFFGEEYDDGGLGESESGYLGRSGYRDFGRDFKRDKWYHHKTVNILVREEREKAYLVEDSKGEYWIPKALLKKTKKGKWKQWNGFNPKYIKQIKDELKVEGNYCG